MAGRTVGADPLADDPAVEGLQPATAIAISAVRRGLELAQSRVGADEITSKGGRDLVTATDTAVEDAIRDVPDDQPPGAQLVAVVPAVDREEVLGQRAPRGVAANPGGELADGRERDGMVLRCDRSGRDTDPGGLSLADRGPDQAGLPETGLAGQEERPAPALGTRGDGRIEQLEDVVAPDDDRALDRAGSTHGAESTARAGPNIGRSTDRRLNPAGAHRS